MKLEFLQHPVNGGSGVNAYFGEIEVGGSYAKIDFIYIKTSMRQFLIKQWVYLLRIKLFLVV